MLSDKGEPFVVAEYDGGVLMSDDFIPAYNDPLTTMIFAGYNSSEIAGPLMQSVMDSLISDRLMAARAAELGMNQLTDEDRTQISEEAARVYEENLRDYIEFVDTDGKSEDEIRAAGAEIMENESGITLASITEELTGNWWTQKYFDEVVKDVTVSDEEVRLHYEEALADQRSDYSQYPDDFEYDHLNGDTILYHPEGYRAVRDVLIPFESDEDADAVSDLMVQIEFGNGDAAIQGQLDELFAPLEAKAQEAQERLNAGESFESLMDEYGCDPLLSKEPLRSEGYYISDKSYLNSAEFIEGSMMLEQPGQVSSPLRSMNGVHLVQYIGEITPGDVPLEQVQDAMRAEALAIKQSEYYEEQRSQMLDQAAVKYYPDRLH